LSEHLATVFGNMGLDTAAAVGLDEALAAAGSYPPDVIICEYDLLATLPLERWEQDELLSRRPVIAVSLTRRAEEHHPLDVNGIAGSLYLPTLTRESALKVLAGACGRVPPYSLGSTARDWPRVPRQAPAR
jgi:hypothetical protein